MVTLKETHPEKKATAKETYCMPIINHHINIYWRNHIKLNWIKNENIITKEALPIHAQFMPTLALPIHAKFG